MKTIQYFCMVLLIVGTSHPQWSTDPTQNLRVTNVGLLPNILSNERGSSYIAYNDLPLLGIHIMLQKLDKYGYRQFTGNGIMIADSSHLQAHRYFLVDDQNGGVIIVYDDSFIMEEDGYTQTHAQHIDSTGQKIWGENGITVAQTPNSHGLMLVSSCSDGLGGCFVFWGFYNDRENVDLRVQHLDKAGNQLWDDNGILITDKFMSYNNPIPCLSVEDDAGGTFLLYHNSEDAVLQRIDSDGSLLWDYGLSLASREELDKGKLMWPNMIKNGHRRCSNCLSERADYEELSGDRIYNVGVHSVDKDGNLLWGENGLLITRLAYRQTFQPQLLVNEAIGSYYIVWRDKRTGVYDVYAQRLSEDGLILWEDDGIKVSASNSIKSIRFNFVASPDSGIIVLWSDYRNEEGTLRAQHIAPDGKYVWPDDVIVTRRESVNSVQVSSFGKNEGLVACWYAEPPEVGIFAQQVNSVGELGEIIETSILKRPKSHPNKTHLFQNFPNPFNSQTSIRFDIPFMTNYRLCICDVNGKEVMAYNNEIKKSYRGEVVWSGNDKEGRRVASGIYFARFVSKEFSKTIKLLFIK